MADHITTDILIAGAGAAGLTMALAAAQAGWRVAIIDPGPLSPPQSPPPSPSASGDQATSKAQATTNPADARTTAVMASGIRMLDRLGVWPDLEPISAPLRYLELIDDSTGHPLNQRFDAGEIDQAWFAQNIPNDVLKNTLRSRLQDQDQDRITLIPNNRVTAISDRDSHLVIETETGRVEARLLVAADGRGSACRDLLRLPVAHSAAKETALVFNTTHHDSHGGVSFEFHGPLGVAEPDHSEQEAKQTRRRNQSHTTAQVTTIPLPGHRSAINIVGDAGAMARIADLTGAALTDAVTAATRHKLGAITAAEKPKAYPIKPFRARRLATDRAVLIGEAAHALAPIGAQGLNTTLADIAVLTDLLGEPMRDDPGRAAVTNV